MGDIRQADAENTAPEVATDEPRTGEDAPIQAEAERVETTTSEPETTDADAPDEALTVPDDLSTASPEDLQTFAASAEAEFLEIYGDGSGTYTAADVARLKELKDIRDAARTELSARAEADATVTDVPDELAAFAAGLSDESTVEGTEAFAKKAVAVVKDEDAEDEDVPTEDVNGDGEVDEHDADEDGDGVTDEEDEDPEDPDVKTKKKDKSMTASAAGRGTITRRNATPAPAAPAKTMKDFVFATGEKATPGTGIDWSGIGEAVADNLRSFPSGQYANAARAGRHLRQSFSVAAFNKPSDPSLVIDNNDPMQVDSVLRRAMDERRLPKDGSLVASGGWCAPSETIYDVCELESNEGLLSLPEITVKRGGIQRTLGPNFADIFNNTGFAYTEAEDIAGDYDGLGGGTKPCFHVECADFEEFRLNVAGFCLTAGLLQRQAYPELIARTARGAMVAHNHKMSARYIQAIQNGSEKVVMPSAPGATAPLLAAIEKQAQHIRYSNRMAANATIEAVFPLWVHGVIREDLAQRPGTDLDPFNVTDQMIDGWFRARGIAPQFVYNWQDINLIEAASFNAYPNEVSFLMYPAGTWVKGGSNVITLDTIYDSQLLGTNDYTALWTEESWMVVKMCQDSRLVTVPLCPNGAVNGGEAIACIGAPLAAEEVPAIGNGTTTSTTTKRGTTTTTTSV